MKTERELWHSECDAKVAALTADAAQQHEYHVLWKARAQDAEARMDALAADRQRIWDHDAKVKAVLQAEVVRLRGDVAALTVALTDAMETIRALHGPEGWALYREHSPEMQRYRAAIDAAGG